MKHKAPSSSKRYSGLPERGPLNVDGGKVMEMLVKMMEVLVNITVMMMAPRVFWRHRERGGESPPPSSSFLASPLDGRRVPPLVHGLHGAGGAGDPPRLDLPLCSLLFRAPLIWPKTISYIPGDP